MNKLALLLPLLALAAASGQQPNETPAITTEMDKTTNETSRVSIIEFYQNDESGTRKTAIFATRKQIDESPTWNPLSGAEPPLGVSAAIGLARPVDDDSRSFDLESIMLRPLRPDLGRDSFDQGKWKWFYLVRWHSVKAALMSNQEASFSFDTVDTAVLMSGVRLDAEEIDDTTHFYIPQSPLVPSGPGADVPLVPADPTIQAVLDEMLRINDDARSKMTGPGSRVAASKALAALRAVDASGTPEDFRKAFDAFREAVAGMNGIQEQLGEAALIDPPAENKNEIEAAVNGLETAGAQLKKTAAKHGVSTHAVFSEIPAP